MIRKPTAQEFRDGAAVRTVRGAQKAATAGVRTAGSVLQNIVLWFYGMMLVFGFMSTAIMSGAWPLALLVLVGGPWLLMRQSAKQKELNAPVQQSYISPWDVPSAQAEVSVPPLAMPPSRMPSTALDWPLASAAPDIYEIDKGWVWQRLAIRAPFIFVAGFVALPFIGLGLFVIGYWLMWLFRTEPALRLTPTHLIVTAAHGERRIAWTDIQSIRRNAYLPIDVFSPILLGDRRTIEIQVSSGGLLGMLTSQKCIIVPKLFGLDEVGERALVAQMEAYQARARPQEDWAAMGVLEAEPARWAPQSAAPMPSVFTSRPDMHRQQAAERQWALAQARPDLVPARPDGARPTFGRKPSARV